MVHRVGVASEKNEKECVCIDERANTWSRKSGRRSISPHQKKNQLVFHIVRVRVRERTVEIVRVGEREERSIHRFFCPRYGDGTIV